MKTREEIIKKAQELLACGALSKEACDAIKADFPELAESEDERIRKALIKLLKEGKDLIYWANMNGYNLKDAIAYLEKQKEQEPLSTEETELNSIAFLEQLGYTCIPPGAEQKSSEWSEEDEKCIKDIIICLEYLQREDAERKWNGDRNVKPERYDGMIAKLKSLRPQPHWKPSEEQMKAIDYVAENFDGPSDLFDNLMDLYQDLKKQM